ncbi:hypothetical protein AWZ03_002526 [Drosophila navojoa]|uniref:Accessory gland protein 25 n=1 Tax=Drosophila navojoa TaxID=7232 RepID=A0A484BR01_DRONA|nr:uncharacterized protein LOC115565778 [Drosophila navojoa]TDG51163.1 hypothetical protein AWZ03_002526 [Drosophila navojoa]
MQTVKSILLLSCLLVLGTNVKGFTVEDVLECGQISIEGLSQLASVAIPALKESAACVNFMPKKLRDLDLEYAPLLGYQFLLKFTGSKKCVTALIARVEAVAKPALKNLEDKKCFPYNK